MSRRTVGFIAVLVPVVALLALLTWALVQSEGNPGGLVVNSDFGEVSISRGAAPPFTLPLLDGGSIDLADLKGKVVMVDFWSSWCPPCIAEAPDLAATYLEYEGQEVEFLGVAIWDEERAIRRHVQRFAVTYLNAIDARGRVAIDYAVRGIPEKYFIDRDGQVVRKIVGPVSAEELRGIIDSLLRQES